MLQRLLRQGPRWLLAVALCWLTVAGLAACTVRLVTPYDEVVDKGTQEFDEAFRTFRSEMARKAGMPEGEYAANVAFYEKWNGKLAALTERAYTTDTTACPGADVMGAVLAKGLDGLISAAKADRAALGGALEDPPAGGCVPRLLWLMQAQFADFAKFHDLQGRIGLPAQAKAPGGQMLAAINAVRVVEVRLKTRE